MVQDYRSLFAFLEIRHGAGGYRCDSAMMVPYGMFESIRIAIKQIKPDAILIAEDSAPVDHEKAFDATYDFPFLGRISSLLSDPHEAGRMARWLEAQRDFYPPGALRLRYLEGHDLNSTLSSQRGLAGSRVLATLLFTIDGIPIAAFARVLPGEQTVLVVINFSDSTLEARLDVSPEALGVSEGSSLSDLLDSLRFTVSRPGAFTLRLTPFQSRILEVLPYAESTQ